jgi:hypothetical protein
MNRLAIAADIGLPLFGNAIGGGNDDFFSSDPVRLF